MPNIWLHGIRAKERPSPVSQSVSTNEFESNMDLSRHRPKTTKDQWKIKLLPDKNVKLDIDKSYHKGQWDRINLGLKPEEMEDKWFIYEENNWLFIHRSWTGHCIYKIRFELLEDSLTIAEAYANRDPNQYKVTDDSYDSQLILWIIEHFLLNNKNYPFPSPPQEKKRHLTTRLRATGLFSRLFKKFAPNHRQAS